MACDDGPHRPRKVPRDHEAASPRPNRNQQDAIGSAPPAPGMAEVTPLSDEEIAGYWCVICQRLLPNDDGVVVHDDVPHPDEMTFDEEERPQ